jgi:hypothetical protein
MAFRTVVNGRSVEADTIEQFEQLLALVDGGDSGKAQPRVEISITGSPTTPKAPVQAAPVPQPTTGKTMASNKAGAATQVIERASSDSQDRLIRELAAGEKTDEELRQALGFAGNKALAGVLSSLTKRGRGVGLTPRDILVRKVGRSKDGRRTYTYRLGKLLAEAYAARNGQKSLHLPIKSDGTP